MKKEEPYMMMNLLTLLEDSVYKFCSIMQNLYFACFIPICVKEVLLCLQAFRLYLSLGIRTNALKGTSVTYMTCVK